MLFSKLKSNLLKLYTLRTELLRLCCLSVTLIFGCYYGNVYAQTSFDDFKHQLENNFHTFKDSKKKEFEDYRNRINHEFAQFMRQAWNRYEPEPPIPASPKPEPAEPVLADLDGAPSDNALPLAELIPIVDVPEPPMPLLPISEGNSPEIDIAPVAVSDPIHKGIFFDYYGNSYFLPFNKSIKISLRSVDENSVSDAWAVLSVEVTAEFIRQCIELREMLSLPDWGYLLLVGKISCALCPNNHNEATLLQMFILTQSGYKMRIARQDNDLVLLMPCRELIYNYSYIPKDGINYYVINHSGKNGSFYVFECEFPNEQLFSLSVRRQPLLNVCSTQPRRFAMDSPVKIELDVAVNQNLIDFYNDYPLSSNWSINANASLSEEVKEQLYPVLIDAISGMSRKDAANILLRFVQTVFKYQTDDVQFGIERSLFPDETFYYSYSDCEDRAILYSVLVRELLGFDAVLVAYPNHLATAVLFDEEVSGDYFEIDSKRYIVCDPTYINADIGMAMKEYKDVKAEIIRL